MAAKLWLIKFFAVTVTILDPVILVDGVKCCDFAFMESSVGKSFTNDCSVWVDGSLCSSFVHPLNLFGGHPLSSVGVRS